MVQRQRLVDTFMQLVQIDSESKHERCIADDLTQRFGQLGLDVYEDDTAGQTGHGAGNLIVTWQATAGLEAVVPIFFTCHMDTVMPGKSIQPRIVQETIYSDGTTILGSDDKAGIACLLEAISTMHEKNIPHGHIEFVITIGEESGLIGARALDASKVKARYGYALDSDGRVGMVCIGGPSQSKIHVVVHGKASHAGVHPEAGVSAITVAAKAIVAMPLGRIDAQTTANIGRIQGGGPTNIVADRVELFAEARSHEHEKLTAQVQQMQHAFETVATAHGARIEFSDHLLYTAYALTEHDRVVQVAKRAFETMGIPCDTFISGGGSDANVFNAYGIPTANLSIGYEAIHTTQEHIRIDDLVDTTRAVLAIVQVANTYTELA